jgi:hypothetical protein
MKGLYEEIHQRLATQPLKDQLIPLFCQTLRWGRAQFAPLPSLKVGPPVSAELQAEPVAQLSGLPVYCILWPHNKLPGTTARRAVHQALKSRHAEHLLCYLTQDQRELAFVWARPRADGRTELRTLTYEVGSPARTTIEQLGKLAFRLDELGPTGNPPITAVTDKLDAAFSVEAVTKQFYQEISNWYFWALEHATFPGDAPKLDGKDHVSLIRLITRLIFCWFLRKKGLIPVTLFDPRNLQDFLNGFAPDNPNDRSSVFYKAILQNLFFATLNTEMGKRDWAKDGQNFMAHNLFRHRALFRDPAAALHLFKDIPFLNGGLFECLDRIEGTKENPRYIRIDGFSRRPDSQPIVPDFLFFGQERTADLSEAYGETRYRKARVRGIIHTLSSYNFTLTENTPLDQEVALDPELLGKVFENLLAAYNPETRTTARKATGSYYTPREIVDYMVDEALIAVLATKLKATLPDAPEVERRLRQLFAHTDEAHGFKELEVETLINAIDHLKILDPACGSGAFPMGILHKLVFVLGKLDPGNRRWKARQMEKAAEIPDPQVRERVLADIEQAFEANELDYGRKLYLIENCIYGVDIQPIAVQIAKLRFFISLVVDQRVNPKAENLGIRALPNLETKFVAANTLIGIQRPNQTYIREPRVDELECELLRVREAHFNAKTPATKRKYREQDARLRAELAQLLQQAGWRDEIARKLAAWDPYDQNASADFFDPEWMFGIRDGFDIVIGNPPYVRADDQSDWNKAQRQQVLASGQYETLWEKWDLFVPFIERSYKLLQPGGISTLIVSDAFCHSKYAQKPQNWLLQNARILRLDFCSNVKIFEAAVRNLIFFVQRADGRHNVPERRLHHEEFGNVSILPSAEQSKLTYRAFFPEDIAEHSVTSRTMKLAQICYITIGMVVNAHEDLAQGAFTMEDLVQDFRDAEHPKRFVEGKHLDKWLPATHRWLEWGTPRAPALFRRPTFPEIYQTKEKVLVQRSPGPDPKCCYDDNQLHFTESTVAFIPWHMLAGVRNNSLKKVARYRDEKPPRPDLPKREELEATSRRFAVKYLLAVMNSTVARDFLRANRRSNIHLYPDDWKKLPIPDVPPEQQAPIIALVDQILAAKRADPSADVSALEREIDERVYRLYGLTPEEIKIVENGG